MAQSRRVPGESGPDTGETCFWKGGSISRIPRLSSDGVDSPWRAREATEGRASIDESGQRPTEISQSSNSMATSSCKEEAETPEADWS